MSDGHIDEVCFQVYMRVTPAKAGANINMIFSSSHNDLAAEGFP